MIIKEKFNISGIPVVQRNTKKLVGILTNRDIRFAKKLSQPVEALMTKENLVRAIIAGLFSTFTIGILTLLTYKTELGVFIIASFGSSMVLLYGYPESPFAQPKNIFFGHLLTALVGVIILNLSLIHI